MILHELHADGAIVGVAIDNVDTGALQRPHTAVAGAVQHIAHRKEQWEIEDVAIPKTILAGIRTQLAEIVRAAAGNHFTETVRGRSARSDVEDRLIEEVIPEERRGMLFCGEPESVRPHRFHHPLARTEEKPLRGPLPP